MDRESLRVDQANGDCDLVMKGGVTSGVVYPYAILKLALKYRFRSIGGASAGAIAAAFAAAAEYARVRGDCDGFKRLAERCEELPEKLDSLFQPAERLRPLHRLLKVLTTKAGLPAKLAGFVTAFPFAAAAASLGLGAGFLIVGEPIAASLAFAIGLLGGPTVQLLQLLGKPLAENGFGLCTGMSAKSATGEALTEWLHTSLQYIAFGAGSHRPLTFGDLRNSEDPKRSIHLRMVTTNLTLRRPHFLPRFDAPVGYIEHEWAPLFPADVLAYLASVRTRRLTKHHDAVKIPDGDAMPVLVATRMSLSFPFLISAIPVHILDVAEKELADGLGVDVKLSVKRGWLSDGGISSNFPVNLFDSAIPVRPTFALSLDPLPAAMSQAGSRVFMPNSAGHGSALSAWPVTNIASFALSILNAAKDWQDNIQASLPGYRERIVRVALNEHEGGLNLSMSPETTKQLMAYGASAGDKFLTFNFEEHRWRRTLASYHALDGFGTSISLSWPQVRENVIGYIASAKSYRKAAPWAAHSLAAGFDSWISAHEKLSRRTPALTAAFPKPFMELRTTIDLSSAGASPNASSVGANRFEA